MYTELSKQEELERLKKAGDRMVRRAQKDPAYARSVLRDIGYYKIMGIPDPDLEEHAANGTTTTPNGKANKTSPRKTTPIKRKPIKGK